MFLAKYSYGLSRLAYWGLDTSNLDQSRTWPGRRLDPCVANIQPGYSGVRRLTSSSCFKSSASSFSSTDPRLSFNWLALFAPIMTLVTDGWCSSQLGKGCRP